MSLPLRPAKPSLVATKATGSVFSRLDFPESLPASPVFTGKPVQGGEKAPQRLLQHRLVQDGECSYHAYSADELIEIDSLTHHGRPGVPY